MYILMLYFADVKEVFDLFDFWDGRDGLVDGAKLADFLYACGMNPTQAIVKANGGTEKLGWYIVACAHASTSGLPEWTCALI